MKTLITLLAVLLSSQVMANRTFKVSGELFKSFGDHEGYVVGTRFGKRQVFPITDSTEQIAYCKKGTFQLVSNYISAHNTFTLLNVDCKGNTDSSRLVAKLNTLDVDQELDLRREPNEGHIRIEGKKATLNLLYNPCPFIPGQIQCRAAAMPVLNVTLPIVRTFTNACGSKVYVAKKDARPVDGAFQSITITDNRSNRCMHLNILEGVSVTYSTISAGFGGPVIKTHSSFKGEQLREL